MIRVGVIGYGYWGPRVARTLSTLADACLEVLGDCAPGRLDAAAAAHPGVRLEPEWQRIIADPAVDAIVVTTPASTHAGLAMAALRAGKHVLVEKPLASRSDDAARLVDEATRRGLVLMVDHTFVYSAPVRAIADLIRADRVGELWYYDSVRANLGLVRNDVNVVWDLATHDLAILDHLHPNPPVVIQAAGPPRNGRTLEPVAYVTLHYGSGFIAHIHVNWVAPLKIRRVLLGGSRQMVSWDDLEPVEKVRVYDSGIEHGPGPGEIRYRTGGVTAPSLDSEEPLLRAVRHFTQCIVTGSRPVTDGEAGLRVVRLLEAAERSLHAGGRVITLDGTGAVAGA